MLNQKGTLRESLHDFFEVLSIFLGSVTLAIFLKFVVLGYDDLFVGAFLYWLGTSAIAGIGWALTLKRNTSEH